MPRPSIEAVRSVGDFLTQIHWDFSIESFPRALGSYGVGDSRDLNLQCVTSDVPKRTGTSMEVTIRGQKVKQPGIYNYNHTLGITFVETTDMYIMKFISDWLEICARTGTGEQFTKEDVEAVVVLTRFDRQNNEIWKYVLYGCFLEDADHGGALSDSSSDAVKPQLTLSYDYFEMW